MKKNLIRIFTAFPAPAKLLEAYSEFIRVYSELQGIRWTPSDNLHVTLFFIGEVEEENLPAIQEALNPLFSKWESFEIEFEKTSFRGKQNSPGMIWAQFVKSEKFKNASERIHVAVAEYMTITHVHTDPIPHITLARIKRGADFSGINLSDFNYKDRLVIDHAELWMTVQSKAGVTYKRL